MTDWAVSLILGEAEMTGNLLAKPPADTVL